MLAIKTNGNILYTIVREKVTEEDFNEIRAALSKLISEYPKVRWFYEMQDFHGWEIKSFFDATKYTLEHSTAFEKIAMTGEKKWQHWMTEFMKPFTSAEVKYFDLKNKKEAQEWIAV